MLPSIAGATIAAVLLAIVASATPSGAEPVDRALADQLTQQMNQRELEQMESGGAGPYPRADRPIGRQLDAPPPPPAWSSPPH